MVSSARKMASWVLGVFRDRSKRTMLHLYKSLVRHRVEYCSPVWNPAKRSDIEMLEDVQRHFTAKIFGCHDMDYHARLQHLKLLSLQRRRERFCIIHMWKILNNLSPNDLQLEFTTSARNGIKVKIPPIDRDALQSAQTLFDHSFSINAAKLWNILPKEVSELVKLDPFKVRLGAFLESFPDTPPTTGYTTANNNSLLEWHVSRLGGPSQRRPC